MEEEEEEEQDNADFFECDEAKKDRSKDNKFKALLSEGSLPDYVVQAWKKTLSMKKGRRTAQDSEPSPGQDKGWKAHGAYTQDIFLVLVFPACLYLSVCACGFIQVSLLVAICFTNYFLQKMCFRCSFEYLQIKT